MPANAEAPTSPRRSARGVRRGPGLALARQAFRDARARTFAFAYLFAAYSYIQPVGYRHAYPTLTARLGFARGFGDNAAIRLFYGEPHNLLTVGGYCAWRVGGTLAIVTAIYGLLAAVRALRGEEDSGRGEVVLAGIASRRTVYLSAMAAIAAGTLLLWLAELAGLVLGGLPIGSSAYLALATVSVVPVCVGVGAITSQLAPTRRSALEFGGAIVGLFFLLRVIADTSGGLGWLRWTTPLGWAEELRPFGGAHPSVLILPVAASALLLVAAARIASTRDIGTGVLSPRNSAAPRLRLLSSPTALALRSERGSLLTWSASVAVFALILGVISKSISAAGISKSIEREISKLGSGPILTPRGYIAFVFIFFILAVSLFVCVQISAARHDEADQRLETLLALPFSRSRFLAGRLLLAAGGAVVIAVVAGLLSWAGAASQGVSISLWQMLEAAANCLPVAMMFLGSAALAYALAPRASSALAYGLVTVTFLWYLVGALTGVPRWVVDLTPFEHVGLVPVQQFQVGAAAIMFAIGAGAAVTAVLAFKRRDLLGA